MGWKKTLLLALIFLVGLGYFFFVERKIGSKEEREERAKTILTLSPDQVTSLDILQETEKIELKRENGRWSLLSPIQDEGDEEAIQQILDSLKKLIAERSFPVKETGFSSGQEASKMQGRQGLPQVKVPPKADEGGLEQYGLKPPGATLQISLKEKKAPVILECGSSTPDGVNFYARLGDKKETVYLLPLSLLNLVSRNSESFRNHRLMNVELDKISRFRIVRGKSLIAEGHKGGEDWYLTEPAKVKGDTMKVSELLSTFSVQRITEFVKDSQKKNPQELGLGSPLGLTISFWEKEKSSPVTLHFGKEKKGQVYVMREGREGVFLIPKMTLDRLPKDSLALQDRHLASFEIPNAARVEVKVPQKTYLFQREKEAWRLVSPEKWNVVDWKMTDFLYQLKQLEFEKEGGALSEAGQVIVWGKKERLIGYVIGKPEKDLVPVQISGSRKVYLVKSEPLKDLGKTIVGLKEEEKKGSR